jgi:regulator of sirC expression with transglutaminase-like and TPR domain
VSRNGRTALEATLEERRAIWRQRLADALSADGPLDIVEAALLVAGEEYPDIELARERARLAAMGKEALRRVGDLDNPFARLDGVRVYLFEELGFRGNGDDYEDPRNSYLNQVLDRRTGIPLTLSIVFMEVARAVGFETRGVGLPGHFVVRVDYEGRTILVDPFHGGQVITEEDCRQLVTRSTGRPSLFRRDALGGSPPEAMLVRLLRNLKRVYLAQEDFTRALSIVERQLLITPDDAGEIRDRGILMAHMGKPGAAVADLEAYLALLPGAPDAESVKGRLAWLRRKIAETD